MATSLGINHLKCDGDSRPLSANETNYTLNYQNEKVSTYIHFNVLQSLQAIPSNLVRKCFFELSKIHFFLQASISKDGDDDYFFHPMFPRMDNDDWIDMECIKDDRDPNFRAEYASESLKRPLDFESGPLWRIIWIIYPPKNEFTHLYGLYFISSHAIIDAKSCTDLTGNQFVSLLIGYVSKTEVFPESKAIFFPNSLEGAFFGINSSISNTAVPWYTRVLINVGLSLASALRLANAKPKIRVLDERRHTDSFEQYPFFIEQDLFTKLRNVCKDNTVSVHSVLMILLAFSLKQLESRFHTLKINLKSMMYTVDNRKFDERLNTSPMPLGVFVSGGNQNIKVIDPQDKLLFFKFCSELTKKIKTDNKLTESKTMLHFITHLIKEDRVSDALSLLDLVSLSNLGDCDTILKSTEDQCIKVVAQYFTVVTAENCLFVSTCTLRGQMFFCISYDNHWLTEEFAECLSSTMKDSINKLVNT